jgi:hypothetical protein
MKFTKAQYDHFKAAFEGIISDVVETAGLPVPPDPTHEEYAGIIANGSATLNLERLFSDGRSCPYYFREAMQFFDFPGGDELEGQQQAAHENNSVIRAKMQHYLKDLLDSYVVGLCSAEELLNELRRIRSMRKRALLTWVNSLKQPKQKRK